MIFLSLLLSSLVALLMPALAEAAPAAPSAIAFHQQASVRGDEMLLGELATLSGAAAPLADVPLGRSPEPGRALVLKRAEVLSKLRVAVPKGAAEVSCPDAVVALRRYQVVGRQEMIDALRAQLERRLLAGGGSKLEVSGFRVSEEPLVPEGKLSLVYELPEANGRLLGSVSLPLTVKVDGAQARKLRIAADVSLECEVVCAARAIERHKVVEADDVRLEKRLVSDLEPMTDTAEAIGKRAERRIAAGSPLCAGDVEEPPVLSRGDTVTIVLESGPLRIATQGVATQGGRVGDTIRVVNSDSKRELLAVIADHSTVRVPFSPSGYAARTDPSAYAAQAAPAGHRTQAAGR